MHEACCKYYNRGKTIADAILIESCRTSEKPWNSTSVELQGSARNRGRGIRTPMNGFGDRDTSHCMSPLDVRHGLYSVQTEIR